MRWYRRDDMDEWASQPAVPRYDRLRELVDELPPLERHIIERTFFGSATLIEAAGEMKVNGKKAREARERGFAILAAQLLEDDDLGLVLPAGLDLEPLGVVPLPPDMV